MKKERDRREKRKSSCERLPDSQNSIMKKERDRHEKRKISCERLRDSQNPIWKRGRVCEKAS
jgi:hypothetical protein